MAEAARKANPDDQSARLALASAHLQLGDSQRVIDDLDTVIEEKEPQAIDAYQYRAIAHARLRHRDQARAELEKFGIRSRNESYKLYLAVVVATELDEGSDVAFEKLDAALKTTPGDSGLHYDAACAYALASQAVARKDKARSKSFLERALSLLRKAIENGYTDYWHMQEDADLDPIRDLPAFVDIVKPLHLGRSYAAVWTGDVQFEAIPLFGVDPTTHLQRCRELMAQGCRIVALSVARTSSEGPPITASVWHRPVITEETKDRLGERQVRAGVALLRMGRADEIMPLLRHSTDPRLRSYIINWLHPLEADPKVIAAELDRIDPNAKPTPAQGQQLMDAVLFHPETSQAAGADPGVGDVWDGRAVSRRAGAIDRQTARSVPQRPRRRHTRCGGMDTAEVGSARQTERGRCRLDEDPRVGRPPMVYEQPGTDLRRDRGTGGVPHGFAADGAES